MSAAIELLPGDVMHFHARTGWTLHLDHPIGPDLLDLICREIEARGLTPLQVVRIDLSGTGDVIDIATDTRRTR